MRHRHVVAFRSVPSSALVASVASIVVACLFASPALAQEPGQAFDQAPEDSIAAKQQGEAEKAAGDRMPGEKDPKDEQAPPSSSDKYDPKEDPSRAYYFIGMRWRDTIVPKFMINIFADGGATVNVFSFGPELGIRKDGFELDIAFSYADYSMNPFLFKGKDDGIEAYERVSSTMKVLYVSVDLLKDFQLDDAGRFSILVGGGVGIGGVIGDLRRNQVFPKDPNHPDPDDESKWLDCPDMRTADGTRIPTQPVVGENKFYCDTSNDHYGLYSEPSWANGGSKPFVFPYISIPQVSFRYKPIKQFQARADVGFSITGFFFGMSAGYGLP